MRLFLVGAPRCATTTVYEALARHDRVFAASVKEPHYFGEHWPVTRDKPGDLEYRAMFAAASAGQVCIDASTSYLYSSTAAEEIAHAHPEAKVLAVLRNPVDRAYSHYMHKVRSGAESLTFNAALDEEPHRIADSWHYGYHYVAVGHYSEQLRRYSKCFGKGQLLVVNYADLVGDVRASVEAIASWIGLDPDQLPRHGAYPHSNKGYLPRSSSARNLLRSSWVRRTANAVRGSRVGTRAKSIFDKLNSRPVPHLDANVEARLKEEFATTIASVWNDFGVDLLARVSLPTTSPEAGGTNVKG